MATKLIVTVKKGRDATAVWLAIHDHTLKRSKTWAHDGDADYRHLGEGNQFKDKAALCPHAGASGGNHKSPAVNGQQLTYSLVRLGDIQTDPQIRGIYLGRFAELLVAHFEDEIESITIF